MQLSFNFYLRCQKPPEINCWCRSFAGGLQPVCYFSTEKCLLLAKLRHAFPKEAVAYWKLTSGKYAISNPENIRTLASVSYV